MSKPLLAGVVIPLLLSAQAAPEQFANPVLRWNFADPFILSDGGRYFAFATNSGPLRVQVSSSDDLRSWVTPPREAMRKKPLWARSSQPDIWAPEVIRAGGRYVMYFSAAAERATRPGAADPNRQCIGVATSRSPDRNFVPLGHPLICAEFEEGVIDASPFRDGKRLYLYYKTDGNCCGRATEIMVQELTPSGLDLASQPKSLGLSAEKPWEGGLLEAPTMIKKGGAYLLFYSANHYGDARYAVGYTRCDSPTGPCHDSQDVLLIQSSPGARPPLIGPGHQSIFEANGRTYIAYHAWKTTAEGGQDGCRAMHIDTLDWTAAGEPRVIPTLARAGSWSCPPP
jgi:beta-xylosidase